MYLFVVGRIVTSQRSIIPNPQNYKQFTWKRGIKVAAEINVASKLILKQGNYPGLPDFKIGKLSRITRFSKSHKSLKVKDKGRRDQNDTM